MENCPKAKCPTAKNPRTTVRSTHVYHGRCEEAPGEKLQEYDDQGMVQAGLADARTLVGKIPNEFRIKIIINSNILLITKNYPFMIIN